MFYINRDSLDILLKDNDYSKTVWSKLETLYDYTSYVMRFESKIKMIRATAFDTEDFQDKVKNLDNGRKLKHDSAISSLSVLNRIADRLGVDHVYEGKLDVDQAYRGEVASAIFEFCKENLDLDKYGSLDKDRR